VHLLARWTDRPKRSGDWMRLDSARRLLLSLPRLATLDVLNTRFFALVWPPLEPLLLSLTGLAALDLSLGFLRAEHIVTLVCHLPHLRTFRCRPVGDVRECLQPLAAMPHLADLSVVLINLSGLPDDIAVVWPSVAVCADSRSATISTCAAVRCC